jgi:hypothetical protein
MRRLQFAGTAIVLAGLSVLGVACSDDETDADKPAGTGGSAGSGGSGTGGSSGTTGGSSGTTGGSSGTTGGSSGTGGSGATGGAGGTGGGTGGTGGSAGAPDVCPTAPTTAPEALPAEITADRTLTADKIYELAAPGTFVVNNATLTIEPCTTIVGGAQAALIITRGAKIDAVGTKDKPIVFTSKKPKGQRAAQDWGGVVLLGRAAINQPGGEAAIEGLSPSDTRGTYGGGGSPVNSDNSGHMSYVRIEFPGYVYGTANELNGLTMGGVGSGTTLDHIMVNQSSDDGFEWFGGTVNASYLVVNDYRVGVTSGGGDDVYDTDFGHTGTVTYFFGRKGGFGSDDSDPNGFESDNSAAGEDYQPYTASIFRNGTMCGKDLTVAPKGSYGGVLRRRTHITIDKTVWNGWPFALSIRDCAGGTVATITNSTIFGGAVFNTADTSDCVEDTIFTGGTGNGTTDPGFTGDDCFADPTSAAFQKVLNSNKGAFEGDATWMTGAWLDWSEN